MEPVHFRMKTQLGRITWVRYVSKPGTYITGYWNKLLGELDIDKNIIPLEQWKRID